MADPNDAVGAFFASYLAAFEKQDRPSLAEHFAFPCHVSGDSGEIALSVVASADEYLRAIEPLFRHYRRLGVARGIIRTTRLVPLSERLALCFVDWDVRGRDGHTIYTHEASYTLVARGGHWGISTIAFNELAKIKALVPAVS